MELFSKKTMHVCVIISTNGEVNFLRRRLWIAVNASVIFYWHILYSQREYIEVEFEEPNDFYM